MKLKPCPFCGGIGIIESTITYPPKRYFATCGDCGMEMDLCDRPSEAANGWNNRPTEQASRNLHHELRTRPPNEDDMIN